MAFLRTNCAVASCCGHWTLGKGWAEGRLKEGGRERFWGRWGRCLRGWVGGVQYLDVNRLTVQGPYKHTLGMQGSGGLLCTISPFSCATH